MEALSIHLHPSRSVLESFLPALKNEYGETGSGIYGNWDVITKRQKNDNCFTLLCDGKPIGFLTWYREEKVTTLEIMWLHPDYRKLGFGFRFQGIIEKEFRKRGDVALSLFCSTLDGLHLACKGEYTPVSRMARFENAKIHLGLTASYIKILKNTRFYLEGRSDFYIEAFEKNGDIKPFRIIPLDADFVSYPTFFHYEGNWECNVVHNGKVIFHSAMEDLLYDLKAKIFGYKVACLDKAVSIPRHWVKS